MGSETFDQLDLNIQELIEQQTIHTPNAIAIKNGNQSITYKKLWEKSARLANALEIQGVKPGEVIGIMTGRCEELVIAILGVLRMGCSFLLIDSNAPTKRIEYMISDSDIQFILKKKSSKTTNSPLIQYLCVEDFITEQYSSFYVTKHSDPEDMIYILYTSGSTGQPKGVQVLHRGVTNYITWAAEYYCQGKILNFPLYSSISFDLTITSIFTPLITGATMIIFEENEIDLIRRVIRHNEVDIVKLTPTHLNMLSKEDVESSNVKMFILGGEALKTNLCKRIHDWYQGNIKIYNEYGPTEATVGCMIYCYDPEKDKREVVPIGLPIKHTQIFILNDEKKPVPYGITGELYIGGRGLAKGYRNKEAQTKQSFIESPLKKGVHLYKTGDLAKVIPGKIIEYVGRKDEQVKLRGYRIELGEIENVLLKLDGMKEAAVVIHEENDNKRLCGYITGYKEFEVEEVKSQLKKMVPDYMIPDYIEQLKEMPVNANGKADKKLLKQRPILVKKKEYAKPTTDLEKQLVEIWKSILQVDLIGTKDNFFDLGGNSMKIVQLSTRITKELQLDCQVSELFAYPTISDFLNYKIGGNQKIEKKSVLQDSSPLLNNDIAIIGIGIKLPKADTIQEFWDLLKEGYDFVTDFPNERKAQIQDYAKSTYTEDSTYLKGAYLDEIDNFDSDFFGFSPKEADLMDPNQRIFLQTCWTALEDAGYAGKTLYGSNTGVFLGYGNEMVYRNMVYKYNEESMSSAIAGTLPSIIPSRISYLMNFTGPAVNFDTACSSSLVALHYACQSLILKECEQAIVGGIKISLFPLSHGVDIGISADDSKTKTFDSNANGTVGGEGSIVMLLKPLAAAQKSRDKIYAVIKGSAINQDGRSNGITAPNPIAQANVIRKAWEKSNVNPETITMMEAHGTGTKLGDPIEIDGITRAFSQYTDKKQFCAIGSVKSNMGHLDHAAGLLGLLKAVLCLSHNKLLPSINFESPNQEIHFMESPVYVSSKYTDWDTPNDVPRRCGVSAFGMSGTNAHVVLEEASQETDYKDESEDYCILTISAKSKYSFNRLFNETNELLKQIKDFKQLEEVCYTSNIGRGHYRYRFAIIFRKSDWKVQIPVCKIETCVDSNASFYGEHILVPDAKVPRNKNEITRHELVRLEQKAKEYIALLKEKNQDPTETLKALVSLYISGCDIDFQQLFGIKKKASLPVYPFQHEKHWVSIPKELGYYTEQWIPVKLNDKNFSKVSSDNKEQIALLMYRSFQENLYEQMKSEFEIYPIYVDDSTEELSNSIFRQMLEIDWSCIDKLVDITSLYETTCKDTHTLEELLSRNIMGFLHAIQLIAHYKKPIIVIALTNHAYGLKVSDNKIVHPEHAMKLSAVKTVTIEYPALCCWGYDIDDASKISEFIHRSDRNKRANPILLVREDKIYKNVIKPVSTDKLINPKSEGLRPNGVYIIFGGTGQLGVKLATYLTERYDIHLILVSRHNPLKQNNESSKLILDNPTYKQLSQMIRYDHKVRIYEGDISNEADIISIFSSIRDEYGNINGVFQCAAAGVGGSGHPIKSLTESEYWDGVKAKISLFEMLEKEFQVHKLDFIVSYSSIITSTSYFGDIAYASANAYLDSYSIKKSNIANQVITINWPTFMSTVKGEHQPLVENTQLFMPITDYDALNQLILLLKSKENGRYLVGEINTNPLILDNLKKAKFEFEESLRCKLEEKRTSLPVKKEKISETKSSNHVKLEGKEEEEYTQLENTIGQVIGSVLGYETIDIFQSFQVMGIHSILFVQVQLQLEEHQINVNENDFYQYDNIYELAQFLEGKEVQQKKKVTKDVTNYIYNDIYYKSCFYHSLFTLLQMHGRDLRPFYVNDLFSYDLCGNVLEIKTTSLEQEDTLLTRQNVSYEKLDSITVEDIIKALQTKKEVIVWIDCFYESMRADTYQKEHLAHTLAVIEYNEDQDTFSVIEHTMKENMDYKQCLIRRDELTECMDGFQKNYSSKGKFNHYIMDFTKEYQSLKSTDFASKYMELWNQLFQVYVTGYEKYKEFLDLFQKKAIMSEEAIKQYITMFSNIANYKALDVFRNRLFQKSDEIAKNIEYIYSLWKKLRNSLLRIKLLGTYGSADFQVILDLLNQIAVCEDKFIQSQTNCR